MSYWAVARLQAQRESLALRFLDLAGFTTYFPRLSWVEIPQRSSAEVCYPIGWRRRPRPPRFGTSWPAAR